jgi:3-hydroxypropanoate dehydrogenase
LTEVEASAQNSYMKSPLDSQALDQLFCEARSFNSWSAEPVPNATLHELYELLKLGPTSLNCCPARFVFVRDPVQKAKLAACVAPGNVVKVEQAPVIAIIGMDTRFYERLPDLFPARPQAGDFFKDPAIGTVHMMRNASLQAAYLIMAARALGLDCGPMSGFVNDKVDAAFFAGTTVISNMLCALGVGTTEKLHPRNPRLSFDTACRIL